MPPKVGEVSQPLRDEKPAAASCCVPVSRTASTPRREGGALDRDLPVALDEHEEDVLAAQAGQQPAARRVAEAVVGGSRRRTAPGRAGRPAPRVPPGSPDPRRSWRRCWRRRRAPRRMPSRAPTRRRGPPPPGATTGGGGLRRRSDEAPPGSGGRAPRRGGAPRRPAPGSRRSRPIEARSVSMPIDVYLQSSMGLNGRSKAVKKPKSSSFTMTRRPSTGPTTQARRRRAVAGRTRASAMTTMPSSGTSRTRPV